VSSNDAAPSRGLAFSFLPELRNRFTRNLKRAQRRINACVDVNMKKHLGNFAFFPACAKTRLHVQLDGTGMVLRGA
jgi:hypothetical protein